MCIYVCVCISVFVSMFMSMFCVCVFQVMTKHEREVITDIRKCNFNELNQYYKMKSEERKNMSKDEKQVQSACRVSNHHVLLIP